MTSPCIPTDTVIDAVADDDGTCAWPGDAGFIRFNQCLVSNYVAAYCCIIMLLKIMLLNESTKHCECYFSETK